MVFCANNHDNAICAGENGFQRQLFLAIDQTWFASPGFLPKNGYYFSEIGAVEFCFSSIAPVKKPLQRAKRHKSQFLTRLTREVFLFRVPAKNIEYSLCNRSNRQYSHVLFECFVPRLRSFPSIKLFPFFNQVFYCACHIFYWHIRVNPMLVKQIITSVSNVLVKLLQLT
jgi:hypothetical protein